MYLVTGGTGFLGSSLVDELIKRGHKVRILTRRNIKSDKFEVCTGNIANCHDVERAMKGCVGVFHLAVPKGQLTSYENHYLVSVIGTENILIIAQNFGIKKVVVMSTMATQLNLNTHYIQAKREQEKVVQKYWKQLICPLVRAPRIYDTRTIKWFKHLARLVAPKIGEKMYFIYRLSVVSALLAAMKNGKSKIYQIADKEPTSFMEFIKIINPKVIWVPRFMIDVVAFLLYPVKWASEIFKFVPIATPDYFRSTFEGRVFPTTKELKYKRYNTLNTIKRIIKSF